MSIVQSQPGPLPLAHQDRLSVLVCSPDERAEPCFLHHRRRDVWVENVGFQFRPLRQKTKLVSSPPPWTSSVKAQCLRAFASAAP